MTSRGRLISQSFLFAAGAPSGMATSAMLTRPSPTGTSAVMSCTKASCSMMPVMVFVAQTTASTPICRKKAVFSAFLMTLTVLVTPKRFLHSSQMTRLSASLSVSAMAMSVRRAPASSRIKGLEPSPLMT